MTNNHKVRRVTKRTYDQYNRFDYTYLPDNLNPINPTQLESQYDEVIGAIQKRIVQAYEKAKVTPPEELFDPTTSPTMLLNDVEALMNKLKGNPLEDIYNNLGNYDALAPFISSPDKADDIWNHPLKLNCSDIESTLKANNVDVSKLTLAEAAAMLDADETGEDADGKSEGDSNSFLDETNGSGSKSDDSSDSTIHITYEGLMPAEDRSKYPETVLESECPVTLEVPTESPDGKVFGGWFYDDLYNQKLANGSLDWPGRDITVYAYFRDMEDDDDSNDGSLGNDSDLGMMMNDDECDLIDLAFLKIILIIVIIAKILITVLVLVVTILKTVAEIVKEAQLCWINPPLLTSLIGYVMQRLGAIIFQILGLILLKLWALLNLDCISKNTVNTISQINAALAGITDLIGSVDSLAISFSDNSANLWKSVKESIKAMKDQLESQAKKVWDDMSSVGDQLKQAGKDIADTYTNPATYLAAVPPEIRNAVTDNINAFKETQQNITNLQAAINNLTNRNGKIQNETPAGVETMVFSN